MSSDVLDSDVDRTTIHASFFSLACGALGMLAVGIGTLISPGSGGSLGWALHAGGWILVSVAIIAHIEHLSNRLGRAAVWCGILGAGAQGLADLPFAINPEWTKDPTWVNYYNYMWATAALLGAASFGLMAIRKEKRMEAHLAAGNSGSYAMEDHHSTVHASFLSLVTGAMACLLAAIGSLVLIDGGGPAARLGWILLALSGVLAAVALIWHVEHLSLSLGRAAVGLAVLGSVLAALSNLPGVFDPNGNSAFGAQLYWILWGAAATVLGISGGVMAVRRRAQDSA